MKYIYDANCKYIISTFDEISDDDIKKVYGNIIISNTMFKVPILKNNKLVETYNEKMTVIYNDKKEILEIRNGEYRDLENSKVFDFNSDVLENKKYYFFNDSLELIFNSELKQSDEEKDKQEKLEEIKKEIEYKHRIDTLEQKIKDLTEMILENFEGGEE